MAAAYFYYAGLSFVGILGYLFGLILLPIIPLILFSFLSVLLKSLTSRFRNNKIWTTIFLTLLTVGFMVFTFSFSFNIENGNPLLGQLGLIEWISFYYFQSTWLLDFWIEGNILSLFGLLVVNSAIFFGFIQLISKKMIVLNSKSQNQRLGAQREATYQARGIIRTLVNKEFKQFLNMPMYAMNSGIGLVLLLLAAGASLVFKQEIFNFFVAEYLIEVPFEMIVLGYVFFCIGMVYTSAVSLSLEGKQLWLIKSIPVAPNTLMQSKIIFNLLLQLPIAFVAILLFQFSLELPILSTIAILTTTMMFGFFTSTLYSVINLYFPKFNFINETEVVKQSLAAILAIFASFATIILLLILLNALMKAISVVWALVILTIILFLIGFGLQLFLRKMVERVFIKLTP